jgi:hypothetical protein
LETLAARDPQEVPLGFLQSSRVALDEQRLADDWTQSLHGVKGIYLLDTHVAREFVDPALLTTGQCKSDGKQERGEDEDDHRTTLSKKVTASKAGIDLTLKGLALVQDGVALRPLVTSILHSLSALFDHFVSGVSPEQSSRRAVLMDLAYDKAAV